HKAATTRDVPFAAAMTFFEQVNHSPYMMRNVLERMALNPQDDFETAASRVRGELADRQGFPHLWNTLSALNQAVVIEIVNGETALTSKSALGRMATATRTDKVTAGRISGALKTLGRNHIIHKIDDVWVLQDPEFGRYVHDLFA
ncbi:MAG: hypothetical protein AAF214_04755, partial [Pseudomonadota bacterium]